MAIERRTFLAMAAGLAGAASSGLLACAGRVEAPNWGADGALGKQ